MTTSTSTGDLSKLVDTAQAQATTISGVVGIQVSILKPETIFLDKVDVTEEMRQKIRITAEELGKEISEKKEKKTAKKSTKKTKEKKNE